MQILRKRIIANCKFANLPGDLGSAIKAFSTPSRAMPPALITILLLTTSNIFMTFAWYGHLKHTSSNICLVVLLSWGIAFFEYCFMVPANRIGYSVFNAAQLKTIQEVITLVVFSVFSVLYLKEPLGWNHALGFGFIVLGAFFIFHKWS
jgi:uncharacterized protein